ncbi:MAG: hypothetical protein AAGM22_04165 [Acidobacteriota bacterium]
MSKTPKQTLDSQSAVELLPWLITDSLDADEAAAALSRVDAGRDGSTNDDILSEVAATAEMLWLTEQRVSSLTLAEFALGLPLTEMPDTPESRRLVQAQIDSCPACQAEVAMIMADDSEDASAPVIDFAAARRRRESGPDVSRPNRRRFALAAALAATITGALLVQSMGQYGETVTPGETYAEAVAAAEENLRTPSAADALFADGFESGDTSNWTFVTN